MNHRHTLKLGATLLALLTGARRLTFFGPIPMAAPVVVALLAGAAVAIVWKGMSSPSAAAWAAEAKVEAALTEFRAIASDKAKLAAWCQFGSSLAAPYVKELTLSEQDAMDKAMRDAITVLGPNFTENWLLLGRLESQSKDGKAYFRAVIDLKAKCPSDISASQLLLRYAGADKKEGTTATAAATATKEPAPPATGGQATTTPFGDKPTPQNPARAAEMTMNPDQKIEKTPAAPAAPPAEEPPPPPTTGQSQITYFGDQPSPQNPPWAAEATMNPDDRTFAAAAPLATTAAPAVAPVREAAVDACRNAIYAEVSASRIYFGSGRYDLTPASQATLKKIATIAKGCGAVIIEVDGFTDNTSTPAYNKKLSEGRAEAVLDFLVAAGVDAAKLRAAGYGEERPTATNSTPEGRRLNRRIEFFVSSESSGATSAVSVPQIATNPTTARPEKEKKKQQLKPASAKKAEPDLDPDWATKLFGN